MLTRLASRGRTCISIEDIQDAINVPYSDAKKVANDVVYEKWLDRYNRGIHLATTGPYPYSEQSYDPRSRRGLG